MTEGIDRTRLFARGHWCMFFCLNVTRLSESVWPDSLVGVIGQFVRQMNMPSIA
jgi:hypothetical protein